MQTIEAEMTTAGDNADCLGTTALRSCPGPGSLAIFLASTVADSEAAVVVGGKSLKTKGLIGKVATNAQIDINSDSPLMTTVKGGEVNQVNVDIVGAGTVRVKAIWMGRLL